MASHDQPTIVGLKMVGLDTNILVRYFAQDSPEQATRVKALIEEELTEAQPGYISTVTIAETVWVLRRSYAFSQEDAAIAVERLLRSPNLVIQDELEVFSAALASRTGRGSFVDTLIGALAVKAGCQTTLTFDKRAARFPGFTRL